MIRVLRPQEFLNRWAAQDAIEELIAKGVISPCRNPVVVSYRTTSNCIRFRIELDGE